jgi:hypothetical protein
MNRLRKKTVVPFFINDLGMYRTALITRIPGGTQYPGYLCRPMINTELIELALFVRGPVRCYEDHLEDIGGVHSEIKENKTED